MSLAKAMEEIEARSTEQQTKLDGYLRDMSEEDRELVETWLADPVGYPHGRIAQALTKAGYPIGRSTIQAERARREIQ